MKKLLMLVLGFILMASISFAGTPQKSIGKTADTLITTGSGYLAGMVIHTDGTNSVTVDVYDNTAGSGNKLVSSWTVTTSASNRTTTLSFGNYECLYFTGIYVDITTSGTVTFDVYFNAF